MEKRPLLENIQRSVFRQSDVFRTRVVTYRMTLRATSEEEEEQNDEDDRMAHGIDRLHAVLTEIMERVNEMDSVAPDDLVGFTIDGGDLVYPVSLPIRKYHSPNHQWMMLMNAIESIQQSRREWLLGCSLNMTLTIVRALQGRGPKPNFMTEEMGCEQVGDNSSKN